MARTADQIVTEILGQQLAQIAILQAKVEELTEQLVILKKELENATIKE